MDGRRSEVEKVMATDTVDRLESGQFPALPELALLCTFVSLHLHIEGVFS